MFEAELELEAELENLMASLAKSDLESEAEGETAQARLNRDRAVISAQMARGIRDENKLTDAVFDDRHAEWTGKSLKNAQLSLRQEWIQIRDAIVRPQLKQPVAAQPATPTPVPAPPRPATTTPTSSQFGFSTFENILKYRPDQYPMALMAQTAYQRVSGLLPYYQKIMNAVPRVSISESNEGIGNLVFSMPGAEFSRLVDDQALRNKALEIAGAGVTSELVFSEDVIGVLGLGLTLLEIAQGLENDRMLKGTGPENAQWRLKQQYQFVFGVMAEDISRRNYGDGFFFSRNSRDLAVELASRFAEFQPIFYRYQPFFQLESDLGRYQGNPPVPQTTMSAA
jgi:hypothetical protein